MALWPIFCVALGLVLSVKAKDSDPNRETLRNIFTEGHKDHKEIPSLRTIFFFWAASCAAKKGFFWYLTND